MKVPLQITFRHMETSSAVEELVREQVAKLDRHCPDITSCRVMVEAPNTGQRHGGHYQVRVDVTLPGTEIVATRDHANRGTNEDCFAAVRSSFRAALRELETFVERRREDERAGAATPRTGEE